MPFMPLLNQILALFLILFFGYYLRKKGIIKERDREFLFDLLLDYILPFMIISAMMVDIEGEMLQNVLLLLAGWAGVYFIIVLLASLTSKRLSGSPRHRQTIKFLMIFSNIGYMGLPVLGAIFPEYGVFYGSIGQIPFNAVIWTYGIYILQEKGESMKPARMLQIFKNNGTLALGVGFFILLTGIEVPGALAEAINLIGDATFPFSMIVIGASLYGMELRRLIVKPELLGLSLFKLLVFPLAALAVFRLVSLPAILASVITLQIAMPAAANSVIFAARFSGDHRLASEGVFITTLLSLFTIPFITAVAVIVF
ncbi:AEC family transporter [Halarsenatibacter silvermanii]|uniref:AEC family transporter n=1 Tax=Halarsenatibacter silvermanii TaxID=321763 RepID=A0A1G9R1S7_9FIRM|nr:AEC family transporter [Halarsenatibacter silvermanii]SDM17101.1 hypothetical protein SAMN04488692_11943 [Halarsenatibacter silvermanii]